MTPGCHDQSIAIIGAGLRLPQSETLDALWSHLAAGRCLITDVSPRRWDPAALHGDPARGEFSSTVRGGFIEDADAFDAAFFNISPREAAWVDPQQRFALELAWRAIEDAGYPARALAGTRTGVYVGVCHWDYAELIEKHLSRLDAYTPTGIAFSIIANRVSHFFDLRGPSIANDTACAASMTSVYEAVRALQAGECELALAGGVNLIWSPNHFVTFSKNGMLSREGASRAFDQRADGYVRGEGGAMLLLKPLARALADGDPIHAVIRGVGVNHGGRTNSLTVTNPQAQADLIADVVRQAGVAPDGIDYVEAHGTGTPLGDPIEISGLKKAFARLHDEAGTTPVPGSCVVGSVKTNIGHLEGAAGVAGMVKVLAALRHGALPANADFAELNSLISLDGSPLRIAAQTTPWLRTPGRPRRAGVSSFGFGGSNGHVLLEEAPARTPSPAHAGKALLPLSARDEARLRDGAAALLAFVRQWPGESLADLAWTYQAGREAMAARVAFVVKDMNDLAQALAAFVDGQADARVRLASGVTAADAAATADALEAAAARWLQGAEVDWAALHGGATPRRIHAPGCAFARERHWMDPSQGGKDPSPVLHPLLQRNVSRLGQQAYQSQLVGTEFFWAEHHVGGEQILPGVTALEMARAAWEHATGSGRGASLALSLEGVVWAQAIRASEAPAQVHIRLQPRAGTQLAFEISDGTAARVASVQGLLQPQAATVPAPERLELDRLRRGATATVEAEALYQRLRASGMHHGPTYQAVSRLWRGQGYVLASLKLPRRLRATLQDFPLHPVLLDAAIQVWAGLEAGSAAPRGAAVPFACRRVQVLGPCEETMWALLTPAAGDAAEGTLRRFDIALADRHGTVRVRFEELALRLMGERAATDELVYAVPRWLPQPLAAGNGATDADVRLVTAGLAPALAEEVARLCGLPLHQLPALADPADEAAGALQWYRALRHEVAQSLRGSASRPTQWFVLAPADLPATLTAPLASLLRTAAAEQPRVRGAVLRAAGELSPRRLAALVVAEGRRNDDFTELRHEADGQRLALRHVAVEPPPAKAWPAAGAAGAVWITGGLGGLSRHFAPWLAARGLRRVVLSGRAAAPDEALLQPLRDAGVDVHYRACDVADAQAVRDTVRWITGHVGPLRGVVHAAGLLRDGYLFTKDDADVAAVFAPKVAGLVHIDAATCDIELDFMLLCSSIAGVCGNPAQADYGAANAFMDAFAAERAARVARGERRGTPIAVAWPLWAEGGMQVDAATLASMQRRFGTVPLPTGVGLAALERLLGAGGPYRVLLQYGAAERIHALLEADAVAHTAPAPAQRTAAEAVATATTASVALPAAAVPDAAQLRDGTVAWLKDLLAELVQMDAQRIRGDRKLEEYGLDSITIVEMTNRMEEALGPLSKTLFFEYVNLDDLAAHLAQAHAQALAGMLEASGDLSAPAAAPAQATTPAPVAAVPEPAAEPARADTRAPGRDIAIVGLSLRVSGAADQNAFWHLLEQGLHGFERYPASRWDHDALLHPERDVLGKTVVRTGAFVQGVDEFDPRYFRISQAEAELMSPEVRLFLQSSVEAFEDAGYSRETLQRRYGGDVAVIVGSMTNEYDYYGFQNMLLRGSPASGSYTGTVPNMVSYFYGFTGPSYFLDTMCSGAATCVHEAVQMLRTGRCQVALAGGINLLLHPQKLIATSQEHFTTRTGDVIRGYGLGADGTILGEGVGAFVMKRLEDAERDGDHIYGVIKGSGISNAGVRNGFTVPSPQQQAAAIEKAWQDGGVDPRTIGYIEGHGSGTSLGDPIEVKAITQAFAKYTDARQFCAIGTVKSNVAHLLHAAAVPGIAKVLLQMKHGVLVPSLHAQELNPNIDFAQTPVRVQRELAPWKRLRDEAGRELPLRAGVTSIGAGGMNAHIVLEEYRPAAVPNARPAPHGDELCVFSAMTPAALRAVLTRFCGWLEQQDASTFADVAWTLREGKNELPCRLALVAGGQEELLAALRGFLAAPGAPAAVARGFYSPSILEHDLRVEPPALRQALDEAQLERLADWWSKGVTMDWTGLRRPAAGRRVSLPSYPFEKVRCWYPSHADAPSVVQPLGARNRLHPFLGSNRSDLHGLRYHTVLHRGELLDYAYTHERRPRLLPLALVEVLAALPGVAGAADSAGIEQLEVAAAPDWSDGQELTARIEADAACALHVQLTLAAAGADETAPLARARVLPADGAAAPGRGFDLDRLRRDARASLAREQVVQRLASHKLTFKPYLEVVAQAWLLADGGVLCAVDREPAQQDRFKRNVVLPAHLLGAAWQALVLACPEVAGLALASMASLRRVGDPAAVQQVLVHPREVAMTHDVFFLDANGAEVASMLGLAWAPAGSLKALEPDAARPAQAAVRSSAPVPAAASVPAAARSTVAVAAAAGDEPTQRLSDALRQLVADQLKFPLEEVSPRALFHDLGFDSISLTSLAGEINARFDSDITPALFYQCEHVQALAAWLSSRVDMARVAAPAIAAPQPAVQSAARAPAPATVENAAAPPCVGTLDLAIIGLAARLPGSADADEFFNHLLQGRDLVGPLPLQRYGADYRARVEAAGFPLQGGFLQDVDRFDAAFFKTTPHEASRMDPQQRLMLETAWHAIENAGYAPGELAADTGVFVGVSGQDYARVLQAHGVETDGYVATGNSLAMVANRLSWHLNLSGPSEAVDTACSSSIVALLRAADAIRGGHCRMALVGGVNLALAVEGFEGPWKAGMLSPHARCQTFAATADGYVRGEGVVALLLKPRADAERDGDRILGLLIGGAQNHGGRAGSLTAPNANAQAALVREAMQGISAASIGYIETHGTGTGLGDPVEVNGLRLAYGELLQAQGAASSTAPRIGLGALKSSIGHLEAAAGLAGVAKVLLALRAGELPPNLHCEQVNPYVQLDGSPFFLVRERQPWPAPRDAAGRELPRRAAVSSFGFGGSNAHVVLQAPPATAPRRRPLPARRFSDTRFWIPGVDMGAADQAQSGSETTVLLRPQWLPAPWPTAAQGAQPARRRLILPCDLGALALPASTRGLLAVPALSGDIAQRYQALAALLLQALREEIASGRDDEVLVQLLVPLGDERAVCEGLGAMLDTAHAECPRLLGQVVGVSAATGAAQALALLDAEAQQVADRRVRHVGGERLVRRWADLPAPAAVASPWRAGGVYLITGGMGALGALVARDIARQAPGARLVLLCSAPLDAQRLEVLDGLRELGALPAYRQADVADRDAVARVVRDTVQEHGTLHGVVHCAGVHRDRALIRKTAEQLQAVLAPKVAGTAALLQACRGLRLERFVLFSSLAGATGNPGQADYAAANGFLGALAEHEGGALVAIDWPLWRDGGMKPTPAGERALYDAMGQRPLSSTQGLSALNAALAAGVPEVAVVGGEAPRIRAFFRAAERHKAPARAEMSITAPASDGGDGEGPLLDRVGLSLRELLARISGLPPQTLLLDEALEAYGIDSLMIGKVNDALQAHFGTLSATLFFEHRSLRGVARHLVRRHAAACRRWTGWDDAAAVPVAGASTAAPATASPAPAVIDTGRRTPTSEREPIAIIGMSGRYPGASDLEAFWRNLAAGHDAIADIPADRWPLDDFGPADPDEAVAQGRSYARRGGFLEGFADFDPLFFRISPREAAAMDPQERLFLMAAWAACEDAGYTRRRLAARHGSRVGVFAGVTKTGYALFGAQRPQHGPLVRPTTSFASVANRVSHVLDLHGPSLPVDTMCSSSLTALHEACEHLHAGDCEVALAGGVNLYLHPSNFVELSAARMLSPDGVCRSFGAGGNGFVPGEGVGCVLLKPLSRALADGDSIHALIRGSAVNHGGHTHGYTVPNPQAQRDVVRAALRRAGLRPEDVNCIEAHGTGTELGDPVEFSGLVQALGTDADRPGCIALGSVKSAIGHLEAAAGIAGLAKVVLQMRHRQLAPTLHADEPNPKLHFDGTPFALQRTLAPWAPTAADGTPRPRIAGISSFGAGGANAHVIVEEWPTPSFPQQQPVPRAQADGGAWPILLSARTGAALREAAQNLLATLEGALPIAAAPQAAAAARPPLEDTVLALLAEVLGVQSRDLDREETFDGIGLEDMQRQALRHACEREFAVVLDAAAFRWLDSIAAVATELRRHLPVVESTATLAQRAAQSAEVAEVDLADLAWTLQIGREAMDCRLAIVARTPAELAASLRAWLAGEAGMSQVFAATASEHRDALGPLLGEAEVEPMLRRWLAAGDLARVLGLWVRGLDIDWEALRPVASAVRAPRVLRLPTYPFARERFWIAPPLAAQTDVLATTIAMAATGLSPLHDSHERLERELARLLRAQLRQLPTPANAYWQRWHTALQALLAAHGPADSGETDAWAAWEHYKRETGSDSPAAQIALAEACVRALPRMLDGSVPPTEVMFPDGQLAQVEAVYKQNAVAAHFNERLSAAVGAFVSQRLARDAGARLRILEVGAGTGGTTQRVLATLAPHAAAIAEYRYTDVSRAFLIHGERQFAATAPYLRTALFDAEQAPAGQDVEPNGYDLVIAANVLHATRDMLATLRHVRALLREGGVLLLNETSRATLFTHLTFGLLEGWWRFSDPERRLPGSPSLAQASWRRVLGEAGFDWVAGTPESDNALGQQVLAAAAARVQAGTTQAQPAAVAPNVGVPATAASQPPQAAGGGGLRAVLVSALATTLNVAPSAIDVSRAFADYGLDSILGAELVHALRMRLGITLQQFRLFDASTVVQLEAFIRREHAQAVERVEAAAAPSAVPQAAQAVQEPHVAQAVRLAQPLVVATEPVDAAASVAVPAALHAPVAPPHAEREPIAIVGVSARCAGSEDIEQLWQHLLAGHDLVQPVGRFDLRPFAAEAAPGTWCEHGSFIDGVENFDAQFFNISGLEATYMDPQQRLFLEQAWLALEHAGHAGADMEGRRCGVFAGCAHGDYQELFHAQPPGQAFWGNTCSLIPARIAYHLNLKGPALSVDTACSSSLVAVHLACESLRRGESELALAGGVFVQSSPRFYRYANRARMLSPSGRCAAFGANADGIVPGEAVVALLLRPLSQALADGDTVHGLIKASGMNQDGATNGITAPSAQSQEQLILDIYRRHGIDAARIGMVEAHGTGTALGDPIEHAALSRAFRAWTSERGYCALGSIKSNLGHATTAAGTTGLLRALLALRHQTIPPTLHAVPPNPALALEDSPFFLNDAPVAWPATPGQPRLAAVSSFGFGGTNAHVVLQEAPLQTVTPDDGTPWLLPLSARSPELLRAQAQRLLAHLDETPGLACADLAFTLCAGRRHLPHRLALVAADVAELRAGLAHWLDSEIAPTPATGAAAVRGEALLTDLAGRRGDRAALQELGALFAGGTTLALERLFEVASRRRVPLPSQPFLRKRYWVAPAASLSSVTVAAAAAAPAVSASAAVLPIATAALEVPVAVAGSTKVRLADLRTLAAAGPYPACQGGRIRLAPLTAPAPSPAAIGGELLQLDDIEGVRRLRITGAMDAALLAALAQALRAASADELARAVLLEGSGGWEGGAALEDLASPLECALPVVAAPASASGAGFLLALHADFIVLAEGGRYACPPSLDAAQSALLRRRFGARHAAHLLAQPQGLAGAQLAAGLCAAADAVAPRALELARQIAAAPRVSVVALKRHMRGGPQVPDDLPAPAAAFAAALSARWAGEISIPAGWPLPLASRVVSLELLDDGVALLRMNEREQRNTFTSAFMEGMEEAFALIARTPQCKVVVLTGHDHYFACGGTREGLESLQRGATRFTDREIYSLPLACELPVIAAMQGHAIGAGWSLGLFCDAALYAAEAVYHSNYMWYGFTPGAGATLVFPRRLGDDLGREILFTAREYKGHELARRAVALPVFPAAQVLPRALALARHLARESRQALVAGKQVAAAPLRALLAPVFEQELAMHQTTFIGNARVMERIASVFPAPAAVPAAAPAAPAVDRGQLRALMARTLAEELMIEAADIADGAGFLELGLDSILAVTWIRKLNERLGTALPATSVYAHPTFGALVAQVVRAVPAVSAPVPAAAAVAAPAVPVSTEAPITEAANKPAVDPGELRALMARTLAEELMIDAADIADGAGFLELGLDSILAVTWIRKLNERLGTALPATSVYAHPTFGALVAQVVRAVPAASASAPAAAAVVAPAVPVPTEVPITVAVNVLAANRDEVRALMARTLADELMIEAADIADGAGFLELGLDSILAVTWLRKLNERLGTALPATSVYAHPTFGALVEQVARSAPAVPAATPAVAASPAPAPAPVPAPVQEVTAAVAAPARDASAAAPTHEAAASAAAMRPMASAPAVPEAIAIIGASGRFPMAPDLEVFWDNLRQGRDCIEEVPASRWEVAEHFDPDPQAPGKSYSKWMGAISDIDRFDAAFFNITAREAQLMDPQQRLFLQHAWHAIEDAALVPTRLAGSRCGVFAGSGDSGYSALISERNAYSLIGRAGSILAARIAYLLDLRGPSVALDTACSTSLVAIAQACESLAARTCDLALAGGACVMLGPDVYVDTSKVNMLSPNGRCHSFDHRANGFVPGEGVGVLLLKRLSDAQRDGDPVRAVIRGWGVNQDGKTNGITAPNPAAQAALMRDVHARFAIEPASIGLIEAHGTGTPLGDPIEVEGLNEALAAAPRHGVALGSVKSNVGHLLAAAGVAGAIKAMLALQHAELPPSIHFERANEHLALKDSPLRVNTALAPWPSATGAPRRAGVSSFGFSGTNAHLVLEESPRGQAQAGSAARQPLLCVLSARGSKALAEQARTLARHVQAHTGLDLADVAHTLQTGRAAFEFRAAFLFESREELLEKLRALESGTSARGLWQGSRDADTLALFEEDADGRELLRKWLSAGRLDKLADAWTKGVAVDWQALPGAALCRRVHLPGYAFARDRHWVEPAPAAPSSIHKAAPAAAAVPAPARLHPLIDRNASTLERARFAGRFSGDEAYLSHYVQGAQRLLLGLFYPEMARAAGELAAGRAVHALRHMVWGRPASINGEPRDLCVVLAPAEEGLLYRICVDGDEARPCHLGELLLEPQAAAWPASAGLAPPSAGQDVTAAFKASAPRAAAVHKVLRLDGELWAQWRLQDSGLETMVIDPLALDALWALVAFHEQQAGLPGPRFPHALQRLLHVGPLPREGWVRLWQDGTEGAAVSLLLGDGQGRPCLWLDGLLTERVGALPSLHLESPLEA